MPTARMFAKFAAAVTAHIMMGLNAVRRAHHDDGVATDLIDVVITYFGNLFFTASHLPDARPQFLHLKIVKRFGGITIYRNRGEIAV